jgi:hypothetical protein
MVLVPEVYSTSMQSTGMDLGYGLVDATVHIVYDVIEKMGSDLCLLGA